MPGPIRKGKVNELVVNCALSNSFLQYIDSSAEVHMGKYIFKLVDKCIEEAWEKNVVQIVSDKTSNNMVAANLLKKLGRRMLCK